MGLTPVNQFVLSIVNIYGETVADSIGEVRYSWDAQLSFKTRDGTWLLPDFSLDALKARTGRVDAEFIEQVVMKLFKRAGWDAEDVSRISIDFDRGVPPEARCTTRWFLKIMAARRER